jgi:predicted nucleic acid-binding protein
VIITFDTNVLAYATALAPPLKVQCARDLIARSMQGGPCLLLLQTLEEFAYVAIRKARMPADDIRALIETWCTVLPVHAAEADDLAAALEAVKSHRFAFWDAMMWATARRAGVRYLLTEDMQDGLALDGVRFLNPFRPANDALIEEILPAS